jgi:predicted dehydrogenase
MSNSSEKRESSRREFLRSAALSAAATVAATEVAKSSVYSLAPSRVLGANDRILLAHVGVGGQGMAHVGLTKREAANNNTQSIAVCDIYVRRMKHAQRILGLKDNQAFQDYRKLLENKDINAVFIATSDNWHAQIALDAMNLGKHVYIEKPMCKTLEETFALYDTVKKTKRILQVGSQGCSDPRWHAAGKMVRDGKIGKVIMAQGSYCRNGKIGEWNYYHIDKDAGPTATGDAYVDWKTFRKGEGPEEWDPDRYFRWRKYYAYGNGIVGDLFPHRLHPLMIAMNLPLEGTAGYPTRVASLGGIYVQKINPETGKKDREVPDFTNIIIDFAEECSLMLLGSTINEQGWEDMIRGNKATIYLGGDSVEVKPERVWADEVEPVSEQTPGGEPIERHEKNFFDCIRNNGTPNCGIDLAARVQTMITLGDLAYQQGKTMHFDPKTRKAWG